MKTIKKAKPCDHSQSNRDRSSRGNRCACTDACDNQKTPFNSRCRAAGKEFAAQHAEGVFVAGHSPSVVAKSIAEIRQLASTKFGRKSEDIKFLSLLCPVLGKTQEEADAKFKEYRSYASVEGALALLCGWTGIDFGKYGDDEELRQVESNAVK